MSRIFHTMFAYVMIQVLVVCACAKHKEPNQEMVTGQQNTASRSTKSVDPELTALIKTFSEDVGENGQAAWRKLRSYPRKDLINSLLTLQDGLPKDDPRQYSIAFVLCNLDYEYQTSVQVIVSALTKVPHNQNYYADIAAAMLGRLTHRGDKGLLRVLFAAVPWSDAALAEGLSDTFSEELRDNPKEFLLQLKEEPKNTRAKVYKLIHSGLLTGEDIKKLRGELTSLSRAASTSQVARELLASSALK